MAIRQKGKLVVRGSGLRTQILATAADGNGRLDVDSVKGP